jgi:hypothetical protein
MKSFFCVVLLTAGILASGCNSVDQVSSIGSRVIEREKFTGIVEKVVWNHQTVYVLRSQGVVLGRLESNISLEPYIGHDVQLEGRRGSVQIDASASDLYNAYQATGKISNEQAWKVRLIWITSGPRIIKIG